MSKAILFDLFVCTFSFVFFCLMQNLVLMRQRDSANEDLPLESLFVQVSLQAIRLKR